MIHWRQNCRRIRAVGIALIFIIELSNHPLLAQPKPMEWSRAQDEAVSLFQDLIRINTSNPPGNEILAANYLKKIFDEAGVPSNVYESAPGRGNLIARLKGDGKEKPLLLLGHLDVVGVERDHWTVDPFGAEIKNGRIYGRGASDMKALVAAEVMALLWAKRSQLPLHRDLIFAGVSDEESSGKYGIQFLINKHWPEIDAEFSFNEGGRGRPSARTGKVEWVGIQTTEKRPYNLRLVAHGTSAHASLETPDNPIYTLARALHRLAKYEPPMKLNETTQKYLEEVGKLEGLPEGWYEKVSKVNAEDNTVESQRRAVESAGFYATLHDTISPTILRGGFRSNVIPAVAEVNLNCRLLPDTDITEFVAELKNVIHESMIDIEYDPDSRPRTPATSFHTAAFKAYDTVVKQTFGESVPLIPVMGTGATDSAFLRAKGMASYGIAPFVDDKASYAHGNNESISLSGFRGGVKFVYEVIQELER